VELTLIVKEALSQRRNVGPLELSRADPDCLDLVVADMPRPQITGAVLARGLLG